jgi:hypothetical protein
MATAPFTPGDVVEYRGTLADDHGLWVFAGPSDRTPPGWPEIRYRLVRPGDRLESGGADSIGPANEQDMPEELRRLAGEIAIDDAADDDDFASRLDDQLCVPCILCNCQGCERCIPYGRWTCSDVACACADAVRAAVRSGF